MIVSRLNNSVVAMFYKSEGSGMGNERSKLQRVYVANSREEIESALRSDYSIQGDIQNWLNSKWASLTYYDSQSELNATN